MEETSQREVRYIVQVVTGEVCTVCDCEMTVSAAAGGGSELTCDCATYLVA